MRVLKAIVALPDGSATTSGRGLTCGDAADTVFRSPGTGVSLTGRSSASY
ncbi:hypothetical protein GCM10023082_49310 [Streptomyces tremellae]|uniref:Uncharacterized protein n=1 Tax=Streptomyces tremellae TaxID=1124239 RepID=A0ABP7FS66_9ACTN